MIASIMGILDRVVLRATGSGLWMILISYQIAERSDPVFDPRGVTTLSTLASWLSVATGAAWLTMAVLIALRRGVGTRTWTRSEHVVAIGCSVAFLGASLAVLSPVFFAMSVGQTILSIMDLIEADRARDLVDEFGIVDAAAEFEARAGSRRAATSKALSLLSVRDEIGDRLADEVLCGIPIDQRSDR